MEAATCNQMGRHVVGIDFTVEELDTGMVGLLAVGDKKREHGEHKVRRDGSGVWSGHGTGWWKIFEDHRSLLPYT
jgi:hypothetical protein